MGNLTKTATPGGQAAVPLVQYDDLSSDEVGEIKRRLWTKWEHIAGDLSCVAPDTGEMTGTEVSEIIGDLVHGTDLSEGHWSGEPTRWNRLSRDARNRLLNEVFPKEVTHSIW